MGVVILRGWLLKVINMISWGLVVDPLLCAAIVSVIQYGCLEFCGQML